MTSEFKPNIVFQSNNDRAEGGVSRVTDKRPATLDIEDFQRLMERNLVEEIVIDPNDNSAHTIIIKGKFGGSR